MADRAHTLTFMASTTSRLSIIVSRYNMDMEDPRLSSFLGTTWTWRIARLHSPLIHHPIHSHCARNIKGAQSLKN